MKTNRIIIVINDLIEMTDESFKGMISHQSLYRAYRDSNKYSLCWDDIFIGNVAEWTKIQDRIDEYALLSQLREGKLELLYYSFYDQVEKILDSTFKERLQFYDQSITLKELSQQGLKFDPKFKLELHRLKSINAIFPNSEEVFHHHLMPKPELAIPDLQAH